MEQSWVVRNAQNESLAHAIDNRKRIMGSSLFGSEPAYQPQIRNSEDFPKSDNQQQQNNQIKYIASQVPTNYIQAIPTFEPMEMQQSPFQLYDASLIARQPPKHYSKRRLETNGNNDLKKIRDELVSDCSYMVQRLRQIGFD